MSIMEWKNFVETADGLDAAESARVCYAASPARMSRIRSLEQELGILLFIGEEKSMHLTTAGKMFYHEAQNLLLQ